MSQADTASGSEIHAYPAGTTFHEMIRRNRRNSVLLVLLMMAVTVVVFVLIAFAIMVGLETFSWVGLVVAGVVAVPVVIVASLWSYYRGGKAMLRQAGAKKIEREHDLELFNVVEELTIASGLPMPEIYLVPSKAMNAFATGRDPEHAAVAITTSLRKHLSRDELQAVMAHELAHIRHYDIRLTMMVATLAGVVVMTAATLRRGMFYGAIGGRRRRRMGGGMAMAGGRGRGGGRGGGAGAILMIVILVVVAIVAPIIAKLIQMAVSRQREYLADAGAVEMTRNPQGLADALRKLSADHTELKQANEATAHAYIVNPILNARGKENLSSMMSTHPPVQDRIKRVEALMR